ncbi:MAG: 2-amino-4-hydroxy-6-hydroxymethyldihydropteridine diphosphokinase [Planctomycetota bacterium]
MKDIPVIAYLGLGSNLGDRPDNIRRAVELLNGREGLKVRRVAEIFASEPVAFMPQDEYLNTVAEVETLLEPEDLLRATQAVERELGRDTKADWGPRTIDIDILFYGDAVIVSTDLVVPHPLVCERIFVLKPMVELAPEFAHPVFGKQLARIFAEREKELNLYHCLEL